MEFLHQQLNSIGPESPVLSGLLLLGSSQNQRLQGGVLSVCIRVQKSTDAAYTEFALGYFHLHDSMARLCFKNLACLAKRLVSRKMTLSAHAWQ
jgi:hypothetical protein